MLSKPLAHCVLGMELIYTSLTPDVWLPSTASLSSGSKAHKSNNNLGRTQNALLVNPSLLQGKRIKIWPKSPTRSQEIFKVFATSSCLQITMWKYPDEERDSGRDAKLCKNRGPGFAPQGECRGAPPELVRPDPSLQRRFSGLPSFLAHLLAPDLIAVGAACGR